MRRERFDGMDRKKVDMIKMLFQFVSFFAMHEFAAHNDIIVL